MIGEGIGGYEILTWACEYPDEMEFILVLNSACKNSGYKYIVSKCIDNIIDIADDANSDAYNTSLSRALIALNTLAFSHTSSKKTFNNMDKQEIEILLDNFIEEGFFIDIYDFKYNNDSLLEFDVEDKLPNIKAKTLIIGNNKNYFNYEQDTLPLKESIKDSIVLTYNFEPGNYNFEDKYYEPYGKEIIEFLSQFK